MMRYLCHIDIHYSHIKHSRKTKPLKKIVKKNVFALTAAVKKMTDNDSKDKNHPRKSGKLKARTKISIFSQKLHGCIQARENPRQVSL